MQFFLAPFLLYIFSLSLLYFYSISTLDLVTLLQAAMAKTGKEMVFAEHDKVQQYQRTLEMISLTQTLTKS